MQNIVHSPFAEQIAERLDVIADLLNKNVQRTMKFDVYKGKAGVALFFYVYAKESRRSSWRKLSERLIREALKEALKADLDLSLYAGVPGVLWVAKFILGEKELNKLIPRGYRQSLLLKMAEALRYSGLHELAHGAIGWWIFSETVPSSSWFRGVVLEYLRKTRNIDKNGWWTSSGQIGFGMAHGMCPALLIRKDAGDLRRLKTFLKPLSSAPLPPLYPQSLSESVVQSAWCYGDAGAGFAFTKLARDLEDKKFEETAKAIFRRGIYPNKVYRKITDPFICHGYSGQALLALRFWSLTGEEQDLSAVEFWEKKLAEMPLKAIRRLDSWGLHDGLAGMGLVLLALRNRRPEKWDRLLMLS